MKIRNKIKIACEGQHCLILVLPCFISPVRRATAGIAQLARAHGVHSWEKNRKLYRRSEAFQNNDYVSNGVLEVVT